MKLKRRPLRDVALLPTLITLGNGVCGFLALIKIGEGMSGKAGSYETAAWLILMAMVFDALDGKVARLTRTASRFGGQLDSLCDVISFGMAPAFLVHAFCTPEKVTFFHEERLLLVICIFYATCTIVRLARFNVENPPDEKYHLEFAGLPSPAAAGVIASLIIPWSVFHEQAWAGENIRALDIVVRVMPLMTFLLGLLMVSRIKYIHILNRLFRGTRPFINLVEVALFVILLSLFHEFTIFLAFGFYMISGPFFWMKNHLFRKAVQPTEVAIPEQEDTIF